MTKQHSFSKSGLVDHRPVVSSTSSIGTIFSVLILFLTCSGAVGLRLIPYEYIGRNRVPAIIFKGLPSTFHGFVISIMFAFSGAFSSLLVPNNPKISGLCRYLSTVFMLSAVGFLFYATFSQVP